MAHLARFAFDWQVVCGRVTRIAWFAHCTPAQCIGIGHLGRPHTRIFVCFFTQVLKIQTITELRINLLMGFLVAAEVSVIGEQSTRSSRRHGYPIT